MYTPEYPPVEPEQLQEYLIREFSRIADYFKFLDGSISVGLDKTVRIGDPTGGDYVEIGTDGTVTLVGDATVWDDIQESLINRQLSSPAGKLDYNWANSSITASPSGSISSTDDCLIFNIQLSHKTKATTLKLHMHWEQVNTNSIHIDIDYRIQYQGSAKTTAWTSATQADSDTDCVFTYSSGTLNQIMKLVSIDISACNISDIIQFRVCRTDSTTGDIEITYVDAHFEIFKLGSGTEYSQ